MIRVGDENTASALRPLVLQGESQIRWGVLEMVLRERAEQKVEQRKQKSATRKEKSFGQEQKGPPRTRFELAPQMRQTF